MPQRIKFVFKTVVGTSDNVEVSEEIVDSLEDIKRNAIISTDTEGKCEILVQKKNNVITIDDMEVTGRLNIVQQKAAVTLHRQALALINGHGDDKGRVKIVFVTKS